MRTILAVALALGCTVGHAAEWTAKHPILRILYDGATEPPPRTSRPPRGPGARRVVRTRAT
jgi:hypothetical protein